MQFKTVVVHLTIYCIRDSLLSSYSFRESIAVAFYHVLQDGEAYAYLLNVLAPEFCNPTTLDTMDPYERADLLLEHAEQMNCKRYLTPKDIAEGSSNLNLAFVAQIFHERCRNRMLSLLIESFSK